MLATPLLYDIALVTSLTLEITVWWWAVVVAVVEVVAAAVCE